MTVTAQFQDIIYKGGNAFFSVKQNDYQNDYFELEDQPLSATKNQYERTIIKTDQAMVAFADQVIHCLESILLFVFPPKNESSESSETSSVRRNSDEAFSSSKRLVEKFNAQYNELHSNGNQDDNRKRRNPSKKGLKHFIELLIGIPVYLIFRAFGSK